MCQQLFVCACRVFRWRCSFAVTISSHECLDVSTVLRKKFEKSQDFRVSSYVRCRCRCTRAPSRTGVYVAGSRAPPRIMQGRPRVRARIWMAHGIWLDLRTIVARVRVCMLCAAASIYARVCTCVRALNETLDPGTGNEIFRLHMRLHASVYISNRPTFYTAHPKIIKKSLQCLDN